MMLTRQPIYSLHRNTRTRTESNTDLHIRQLSQSIREQEDPSFPHLLLQWDYSTLSYLMHAMTCLLMHFWSQGVLCVGVWLLSQVFWSFLRLSWILAFWS